MRKAGMYSGMLRGGIVGKLGPSSLPLARIKKIMKRSSGVAGDGVKMISGEAPVLFSKACELFIEELTRTSWTVAARGKRRTLHKDDIAAAVAATDLFDFLINLTGTSGEGDGGSDLVERDDDSVMKQGGEGH